METLMLRDEDLFPDNDLLKQILGSLYHVYYLLTEKVTKEPFSLEINWNYYKDGKSWLGKVTYKKKTLFWLSVWDGYFKVSFFFTDKSKAGIELLDIDCSIKESFYESKNIGKLIPLVVAVTDMAKLDDVLKIIDYKKGLK